MSRNLFITGTGTDIGKTYVSGLIMKKLREKGRKAAWFKAAASGNVKGGDGKLICGDALSVKKASGMDESLSDMCPYIYEAAVSPHLAARLEGNPLDIEVVKKAFSDLTERYDLVTVEGSGGIACPLFFEEGSEIWLEDLIRELNIPTLIVAGSGLGTINFVILTAEYMKDHDITVKGIIFNRFHPGDIMEEDNIRMCAHRTHLPVLACVKEEDKDISTDTDTLEALYE